MTEFRRIQVEEIDGAIVVTLLDKKILDETNIQYIGNELLDLAPSDPPAPSPYVLNFQNVEYASSTMWGKLIVLDQKLKDSGRRGLIICNMIPEVYEVARITRLANLFQFYDTREEALEEIRKTVNPAPA